MTKLLKEVNLEELKYMWETKELSNNEIASAWIFPKRPRTICLV